MQAAPAHRGAPSQQPQAPPPVPLMVTPAEVGKIELPDDGAPGSEALAGTRLVDAGYEFGPADQIGEGTYGQVYCARVKGSAEKVALKKIRMDQEAREGFPITAIREIKLLSHLRECENIVRLREIVRSRLDASTGFRGAIFMVFDYASFDLTGFLEKHKYTLSTPMIKCLMRQLLTGAFVVLALLVSCSPARGRRLCPFRPRRNLRPPPL